MMLIWFLLLSGCSAAEVEVSPLLDCENTPLGAIYTCSSLVPDSLPSITSASCDQEGISLHSMSRQDNVSWVINYSDVWTGQAPPPMAGNCWAVLTDGQRLEVHYTIEPRCEALPAEHIVTLPLEPP
jgi:hypothetical protein